MQINRQALRSIIPDEARLLFAEQIPPEYQSDALGRRTGTADALVFARSTEEVSGVLRYANENGIPVTPRGAGTNLVGSTIPLFGGIILDVSRMNRILELDRDTMTATVEPGILLKDFQSYVEERGLFYPPDPGEKTASIGGNVITNAGGMKAVRYGLTRDFVRCIEAVLPDGSIMNFSSNVVKNTTGYDIKDLVIGSEGTLCILTQVTLKLLPAPTCSCTLVMPFGSLEECADMVPEVLALPFIPTAIEFLERELIDIVERNLGKLLPGNAEHCGLASLQHNKDDRAVRALPDGGARLHIERVQPRADLAVFYKCRAVS